MLRECYVLEPIPQTPSMAWSNVIKIASEPKIGSDACLMTASRIMLYRAIVLREGQFSRAHTFVV
jgi:hypothetical protein